MKKAMGILLSALLCVLGLTACENGNDPAPAPEKNGYTQQIVVNDGCDVEYVILFYTNTVVDYVCTKGYAVEMKALFGENQPGSKRMYGAGLCGPMLLTQSVEEMRHTIDKAFDWAEENDIPIYFNMDDCTNWYWYLNGESYFGKGAEVRYWEDPEMCEWVQFRQDESEPYGGYYDYGKLPRWWFNWGGWMTSPAFPNLASQKFQSMVAENLKQGVLEPLMARYTDLCEKGKEYLFAGISVGWETHIPDNSSNNKVLGFNEHIRSVTTGETIESWELCQYGYGALTSLGYDQQKLESEAAAKGLSVSEHMRSLLYQVTHDYIEMISRECWVAGIPQNKIYTHIVGCSTVQTNECTYYPPVWVGVNDYSVPGFTMSSASCPWNMDKLLYQISQADPTQVYFANVEGYAGEPLATVKACKDYFAEMFGNGCRLITAYGYPDNGKSGPFYFLRTYEFPYCVVTRDWIANGLNFTV